MRVLALVLVGSARRRRGAGARASPGLPGTTGSSERREPTRIRGLAGATSCSPGRGADFLQGGPGRDTNDAGAGDDLIAASYDGARDVVRCGSGLDVVNADLTDTVASDCELVGRRLSRDPYRNDDAQHETEVEPDSFTFGRTTVATFQVGRRFDGAATNVGFAVTTNDGASWRSGLLPGLTVASRPPGPERARERPGGRVRRARTPPGSSRPSLSTARVTRLAINRSPDGVDVEQRARRVRGARRARASPSTRTGSRATTRPRRRSTGAATSSTRTPRIATCSRSAGRTTAACRGRHRWTSGRGRRSVSSRRSDRPASSSSSTSGRRASSRSRRRARRTAAATWGCAGPHRVTSTAAARSAGSAHSRCPRPRSTRRDASGRRGTTASRPERHETPSSLRRRPTALSGAHRLRSRAAATPCFPRSAIDAATGRVAIAYMRSKAAGVDVELTVSSGSPTTWTAPRRLSAQSMPLQWMPDTTSGRMLGDYISVHYARGRPLVVWVLATEPVGSSFRQAVYATRG